MIPRRPLLLPLVPLYALGLRLKRWLAQRQRSRRRTLESAVLSVGSISAGGAGKTPVVLALARILDQREYAVRILTRGYKRSSKAVERVDSEGDVVRFGDEPLLLAQRSGVPVYVGADRYEAGLMAQRGPEEAMIVHLLDDGFQHRQLARDLDIVLLTRKDVNDVLLPAGDLREPLTALANADVLVVREEEAEALLDFISFLTRETGPPAVWRIRRTLRFASAIAVLPKRPLAFCGIARPESFLSMLAHEGVQCASTLRFPDHHAYTDRDMSRLLERARTHRADGFVTTEKDAVKLTSNMCDRLGHVGPLLVPELEVTFVDERAVLTQLIGMVNRLDRRKERRQEPHYDPSFDWQQALPKRSGDGLRDRSENR